MDESTLVATSMEVQMKATVPTTTTTRCRWTNHRLSLVATAAKVRKILSIEPINATEVPIVTTRPEMPMDA